MKPETMDDLEDSLARERAVKGVLIISALLWLAWFREAAHPYVAIALFALLADLFALNRLRRLVATLKMESRHGASLTTSQADGE